MKIRPASYSVVAPPPGPNWVVFYLFGTFPNEYIRAVEYKSGNPATPVRLLSTWNVAAGHWWLSFVDLKRCIFAWGNRIVVLTGGPVVELSRIEEWDPLGNRIDAAYQFTGPVSVPDSGATLEASITRPMVDTDGTLKWVELEFDEAARTHTWLLKTVEHAATAAEGAPTLAAPGLELSYTNANEGLSPFGPGRDIREPIINNPTGSHDNHGLYQSGGVYQWDVAVRHRDYDTNPISTQNSSVTVKLGASLSQETDVLSPSPMTSICALDGNLASQNAPGPPYMLASRLHRDRQLSTSLFPNASNVYPQCAYFHDGVYGVSQAIGTNDGEGQVVAFDLAGGTFSTFLFDPPFPVLDTGDQANLPPAFQKTFLGAVPVAALL